MLNVILRSGLKMSCNHKRYKISRTHGKKSSGNLICKDCGQIINKKDIINGRRKKSF